MTRSDRVDHALTQVIRRLLREHTDLAVTDLSGLLHLRDGWTVAELTVQEEDWMVGRTLIEPELPAEGVLVLGVHRADGAWTGAPAGTDVLHAGDVARLSGPGGVLQSLDDRRSGREGDRAHAQMRETFGHAHARADDGPDPPA